MPTHSPASWPVDLLSIDAAALLVSSREPADAQARAGASRLIAAMLRGVRVAVTASDDHPAATLDERLHRAGIIDQPAAVEIREPHGAVTSSGELHLRWCEDSDPPASAAPTAGPERPAHQAMLAWLADQVGPWQAAALLSAPLDAAAVAAADAHHLRLTKPPGSLGHLEALGAQLAGIAGTAPPPLPRPAAVAVFAGDHGVHAQGVSPWPQEVTTQMVANFLAGGAAINVLAEQSQADVVVVDVGVAGTLEPAPGLIDRKVGAATADLSAGPAMSFADAHRALDVGAEVAMALVDAGARCLVTGDMGIANTTPAAALIAALGGRPADAVTGRGTGIDDLVLAHKAALVERAAARARAAHGNDVLAVLAEVGGFEHAALAGFVMAGVALQVPVIVDGVIAASSLLVATGLAPHIVEGVIAGHRSVEPGAAAVLGDLGLAPVIDLALRLGEGTGAALALPLVEASARVLREMATFDEAGVSEK